MPKRLGGKFDPLFFFPWAALRVVTRNELKLGPSCPGLILENVDTSTYVGVFDISLHLKSSASCRTIQVIYEIREA